MLEIISLGQLDIRINGTSAELRIDQRRAYLLAYLAETGQAQQRRKLAQLLWPYVEVSNAVMRLRGLLSRMRREGFEDYLRIDRHTIELDREAPVYYDLRELRELINHPDKDISRFLKAYEIYRGSFLEELNSDDYPILTEWANAIQVELTALIVNAMHAFIPRLLKEGEVKTATMIGRHLAQLNPYEDSTQALYIRALGADGHIAEAILHLAEYRKTIVEEFPDHQLSTELEELEQQLSQPERAAQLFLQPASNDFSQPRKQREETPEKSVSGINDEHNFTIKAPKQLIGRKEEITQLNVLLDGGHQLISIVGLGGVGKTLFVRSQFEGLAQRFVDGLYFVNLPREALTECYDFDILFAAIVAALAFLPDPSQPLFEQVTAKLNQGKCGLILDNFETMQVLAEEIPRILAAAPELTILVTSRQRLNVYDEVVLQLHGLPVLHSLASKSTHRFDIADERLNDDLQTRPREVAKAEGHAVQLFAYCAQRIQPDYMINESNRDQVIELCQQLGGLPLAIELAAMQLDFYTAEEMIDAVVQGADLLETNRADMQYGHHSMESILITSWQMQSLEAQDTLASLTIFATIWHRDAMEAIVPASRQVYRELINASLMQVVESGWFSLHPLVKQFVKGKRKITNEVEKRHAEYFLGLLESEHRLREEWHFGEETIQFLGRYTADLAVAWAWSVNHHVWLNLTKAVISYGHFNQVNGQSTQGIAAYRHLIDELNPTKDSPQAQIRLAGQAAQILAALYRYAPSASEHSEREWYQKSIDWLDEAGTPFEVATAYAYYGYHITGVQGNDHEEGVQYLEQASAIAGEHGFVDIQILVDCSLISHYAYVGEWIQTAALARKIAAQLPQYQGQHSVPVFVICEISMFSDDWPEAERRFALLQNYFPEVYRKSDNFKSMTTLYHCYILHHLVSLDVAIRKMEALLATTSNIHPRNLTLSYSYLALLYAQNEQTADADNALIKAFHLRDQVQNQVVLGLALVLLTGTLELLERRDEAYKFAQEALHIGLELKGVNVIFTALYLLAGLKRALLPAGLYEFIVKTALVSPALYHQIRPLARMRAKEDGIVVAEAEAEALAAMDLEKATGLVQELNQLLSLRFGVQPHLQQ